MGLLWSPQLPMAWLASMIVKMDPCFSATSQDALYMLTCQVRVTAAWACIRQACCSTNNQQGLGRCIYLDMLAPAVSHTVPH
jgi:hypothetical protein